MRIMLPGVASFPFSIRFSTRVEVPLSFDNKVLGLSGLSCLLVDDSECLHLIRVGPHSF